MNYCVIAIKDNFQFRSVFCRSKADLLATLHDKYHGFDRAKCLVGQGDICQLSEHGARYYARDWGFNWKTARPSEFSDQKALFDYVRAAGINIIYLFERNQWRKLESDARVEVRTAEVA